MTGAARGIGRADALEFVNRGAAVVVNDLDPLGVDATLDAIADAGGTATGHVGDVADEEGADSLVAAALERFGRLDAVVNNAGITADRMIFNLSRSDWDRVLAVNLTGTFLPTRAAARHWRRVAKERGRPVEACVVNTTSRAGLYGNPGQANYGAAKAGVAAMALIVARELRRYGVRCNAVAPRAYTSMMDESFGAFSDEELERWSPAAVARVVVHLASPESAPITGQTLMVQGSKLSLLAPWHEVASTMLEGGQDDLATSLAVLFENFPAEIGDFSVSADLPIAGPERSSTR